MHRNTHRRTVKSGIVLPSGLYVCHPRREAAGYGNAWMGNAFETTTLTRFIGANAKRKFQCQTARTFRRPAEQGDEAPAAKKPKRKPRAQKSSLP